MSGLLALLDDVVALAKVAASSLDDVVEQAGHASVNAAGVVIDDAAVTPKYVEGFSADRELPIVWKIARGSLFNKLVLLMPAALLLSVFAPWALQPLLLLGGTYLCFEGAEKVWGALSPHRHDAAAATEVTGDAFHLEEAKVRGAVRTDFVLSAEIMVVSLSAIHTDSLWHEAAALAIVAVGITFAVYGSVALLVKMDDIGIHLARHAKAEPLRRFGRGLVVAMPHVMWCFSTIGTAAMLWVGASIILHALSNLGWHSPEATIDGIADMARAATAPPVQDALRWLVRAALDFVVGLVVGGLMVGTFKAVASLFHRPQAVAPG